MGYVDFYADQAEPISWAISRFDESQKDFKKAFFQVEPLKERILRLGFKPGNYRLRVSILNRVTHGPVLVDVEVKDGLIAPVQVKLTAAGTARVEDKDIKMGSKVRGRRGLSVSYDVSVAYEVSTKAGEPAPFAPKDKMPYGRQEGTL
jgi:hypothetical protein